MKVEKVCPMCHSVTSKDFTEEEVIALSSDLSVQEALPNRTTFDREFCITGTCDDCQSTFFHVPLPGDKSWGERLGECEECGAPVWSIKDKGANGKYTCHFCKEEFVKE